MYFDELDLNDNVLDALYDMRFDECTPIQEQCIPAILSGRDLLGVAQTGTGKTAAYLLPILSKLDDGGYPNDAINCVIMSPTRELAQQIDQAMQGFGYYLNDVSSVAVYGGNDGNRYDQELRSLTLGADVVIATPGRLISHLTIGNADLSRVSFFVLDEADRMLDMGFSEDIKLIASRLPKTCQTIMFSATMPDKIEELAKTLLNDPVEVKIAVSKPAEKIKQSAYICYEAQKINIVRDIFRKGGLNRVIIFSGKKQKVKAINHALQQMKINSGEMHSDLEQAERDDILYKFKSGQIDVLVATDIVARGIDIDDIAMVINFDVPHDPEDYVHRIGRTARADRDGVAITFVSDDEIYLFKQIEKFLEREVEKNALPEGIGEGPDYNAAPSRQKNGRGTSRRGDKGNDRKRKPRRDNNRADKPKADANAETAADANAQDKTEKPQRQRKPRREKPQNAAAEQQAGNADPVNATAENAEKPAAAASKRRKPRKRKPQTDNGERAADTAGQTNAAPQKTDKGNNGERRQQNRKRRPNQHRQDNRRQHGDSNAAKPQTAPAAQARQDEPSAIGKLLKKPLSWIKSIGKKQ